jgi:hypothetical protein
MLLASTVFKVLGLATVITIGIKYGAPQLAIPATNAGATIAILLPAIVMAGVIFYQGQANKPE